MNETRASLHDQYHSHWEDMAKEAHGKDKSLAVYLNEKSPEPDDDHSVVNAAGDLLLKAGVALRDDPYNGVKSASMKELKEKGESVAYLWSSCVREALMYRFRGFREMQRDAQAVMLNDGSLAAYNPGSAMRPFTTSPLRDGQRIVEYPPLERIAASVTRVPGDSIKNTEYKEDPNLQYTGGPPYEIAEGADIPLRVPSMKEITGGTKILADGLQITDKLRNSGEYTSEMVMLEAEKHAVRVAQKMGQDGINLAFDGLTAIDKSGLTVDDIIDLVFEVDPPYEITSVFGDKTVIKKYVSVDRDDLYNPSASGSVMGDVAGNDRFGRATVGRVSYDVFNTKLNETGNQNKLLCIDAREVVEVKIRDGSDRATEEFVPRNRTWQLAWDIEYGVNRVVEDPKPRFVYEVT